MLPPCWAAAKAVRHFLFDAGCPAQLLRCCPNAKGTTERWRMVAIPCLEPGFFGGILYKRRTFYKDKGYDQNRISSEIPKESLIQANSYCNHWLNHPLHQTLSQDLKKKKNIALKMFWGDDIKGQWWDIWRQMFPSVLSVTHVNLQHPVQLAQGSTLPKIHQHPFQQITCEPIWLGEIHPWKPTLSPKRNHV